MAACIASPNESVDEAEMARLRDVKVKEMLPMSLPITDDSDDSRSERVLDVGLLSTGVVEVVLTLPPLPPLPPLPSATTTTPPLRPVHALLEQRLLLVVVARPLVLDAELGVEEAETSEGSMM